MGPNGFILNWFKGVKLVQMIQSESNGSRFEQSGPNRSREKGQMGPG